MAETQQIPDRETHIFRQGQSVHSIPSKGLISSPNYGLCAQYTFNMLSAILIVTLQELVEGNEYQYRVSAENKVGEGPFSEPCPPFTAKDPYGQ